VSSASQQFPPPRPLRPEPDSIEWQEYPRITPGEYRAYCKWGKQFRDPGFHRWVCLLRWDAFTDDLSRVVACLPQFFPLGNSNKPRATRRGKYFPEWVRANGGPPARGDRLSPGVFVRRYARVEIGDTKGPVPYSVVRKIIDWETGFPGHSVNKSHSQGRQELTGTETEASKDRVSVFCSSALAWVESGHSNTHSRGGRSEKSVRPSKAEQEDSRLT
jgi:hypothetical protein